MVERVSPLFTLYIPLLPRSSSSPVLINMSESRNDTGGILSIAFLISKFERFLMLYVWELRVTVGILGIAFMISNISVACFTLPTSEAVFMASSFLFLSSVILWIKSGIETVLISTLLKSLV